jgi:predicted metal-dependent hydrolase
MTDRVLEVAGLEVAVKERPARSTMEITVDRDGSLFVAVPPGTPDDPVRDFVDRKQDWIHRKLMEKADFLPVAPPKELVNGEGFRYLGRNYRLALVEGQDRALKLVGGRLCLRRDVSDGAAAITGWYRVTGTSWLRKRVGPWASRCDVPKVTVVARDLGYRWGSYRAGRLNIHWATMQLPPTLIDYVLVHELTHAHHPDHSSRFWDAVGRVQPLYAESRERLAAAGRNLWLGDVTSD